jgi:hypothetical protein
VAQFYYEAPETGDASAIGGHLIRGGNETSRARLAHLVSSKSGSARLAPGRLAEPTSLGININLLSKL